MQKQVAEVSGKVGENWDYFNCEGKEKKEKNYLRNTKETTKDLQRDSLKRRWQSLKKLSSSLCYSHKKCLLFSLFASQVHPSSKWSSFHSSSGLLRLCNAFVLICSRLEMQQRSKNWRGESS